MKQKVKDLWHFWDISDLLKTNEVQSDKGERVRPRSGRDGAARSQSHFLCLFLASSWPHPHPLTLTLLALSSRPLLGLLFSASCSLIGLERSHEKLTCVGLSEEANLASCSRLLYFGLMSASPVLTGFDQSEAQNLGQMRKTRSIWRGQEEATFLCNMMLRKVFISYANMFLFFSLKYQCLR